MPIRFPTEAANDPAMPRDAGTEGSSRGRADTSGDARDRRDEAKPGKDINQAGFVRDRDSTSERDR